MKKNKKPLIIGNWKTNPSTLEDAKKRFVAIKRAAKFYRNVDVAICPPFIFIPTLAALSRDNIISVGAQDLSVFGEGSKTGEISASMIETSGSKLVILGHSERRLLGDTDEVVSAKISQALKTDMTLVVCVGEKTREGDDGEYLNVIKRQLQSALSTVARNQFNQIVIAYEPVWAIGRKDNVAITSHDLHQMVIFIKKYLKESWGDTISSIVPILYGGSVTADNAQDILWNSEVDGLLVGRASWEVETFGPLLAAVAAKQKPVIQLRKKMKNVVAQIREKKKSVKKLVKKVANKSVKKIIKKGAKKVVRKTVKKTSKKNVVKRKKR